MSLLKVGPGLQYATPKAAEAAAAPGDFIGVAPVVFSGPAGVVEVSVSGLTFQCLEPGKKFILDLTPPAGVNWSATDKGAITTTDACMDTVIEDAEIRGVKNSYGNGSAVRHQGTNITMNNVHAHHCNINVQSSSVHGGIVKFLNGELGFSDAFGQANQGHNIYINPCEEFIFTNNHTHDAKKGHLLKTRAKKSTITGNRFIDGPGAAKTFSKAGEESSSHIDASSGIIVVKNNLFIKRNGTDNPRHFIDQYTGRDPRNPCSAEVTDNIFIADGVYQSAANTFWLDQRNDYDPAKLGPDAGLPIPVMGRIFKRNKLIVVLPCVLVGPNGGLSPYHYGTVTEPDNEQFWKGATVFKANGWTPTAAKPLPVETKLPQWVGDLPTLAPGAPVDPGVPADPCVGVKVELGAIKATLLDTQANLGTMTAERDAAKAELDAANAKIAAQRAQMDAAIAGLQSA